MNPPSDVVLLCWRDTRHPQGGGSETYLERVGAELARRGMRVTYLTSSYPGALRREERDGMRFFRAGGRITVYLRVLAMLAAGRLGLGPLAGIDPVAVVDTQNGIPFFATLVASAPTVVLVHHCHREQWPVAGRLLGKLGWFLESRVSPRVHRHNRYVTVSAPSARELVELGVDSDRITVVHNGIDPVPTGVAVEHRGERDVAKLCVLSRLVPHKQVEDALEILAGLHREGSRAVHLDIIGDGWWSSRLRASAHELGVDELVTFHGHVPDERKYQLLADADVHLMPSRKEGWGLAVIEAAQMGVPTVGYRHATGLAESIEDGETGILVDGVDEMLSATRKLLDDPAERHRLGTAAARRARRYSWSATADGFVSVFDQFSPR